MTEQSAQPFAELADSAIIDGKIRLQEGITVVLDQNFAPNKNKSSAFKAAVLTCSDWDTFCQSAKPDQIIEWNGARAGLIEMGPMGYDILVIEDAERAPA